MPYSTTKIQLNTQFSLHKLEKVFDDHLAMIVVPPNPKYNMIDLENGFTLNS